MYNDQHFSNLIYEYFLLRIQFQYYENGDILPSIDILCQEFNVAPLTVAAALRRLRKEGYISMRNGQLTKVIYQQDNQNRNALPISYYSRRRDAFQDLYFSSELLLIPMEIEGMRRMTDEDLADIIEFADRADADDLLHFFSCALQKTENPLVLNLFWEITLFQGFPFTKRSSIQICYSSDMVREQLHRLVRLVKNKEWDVLEDTLISYQRNNVNIVTDTISRFVQSVPEEEKISFSWRLYRERPQICYDLASLLLHEIYMGEYRHQQYLPSYEKMAEKYHVSVSTMRRTIHVVNQIGAVQTINGKGTRTFSLGEQCAAPNFESPAVRRNLAFYLQSFEMLVYSCEGVTKHLLSSSSPEENNELIHDLEHNLETNLCEISIWHYLIHVGRYSRLDGVKEIYRRIYSLFLWGYPLKASHGWSDLLDPACIEFTERMIQYLKANDADGCAGTVKELLMMFFPLAQNYLLSHGFTQEELRLTPSIRLLITTTERKGV